MSSVSRFSSREVWTIASSFIETLQAITKKTDRDYRWIIYVGLNIDGVSELAIKGGEDPEDFHVTLLYGYFTPKSDIEDSKCSIKHAIDAVKEKIPKRLKFDALGRFKATDHSDEKDVLYAQVAAGQLEEVHEELLKELAGRGIEVEKTFEEYRPHMTLAYVDIEAKHPLGSISAEGTIRDITIGTGRDFDGSRSNQETIEKTEESQRFDIFKTDEDKRLVFGWANIAITENGEQLEDLQRDIIDPEELERAVYQYVLNFRDGGEEHIPTMRKKASLVESVMFTKEKMKAMGIPEGIVPEGWWIGFYVKDDDAWERIKNGTYKMFSIEGTAVREVVEDDVRKYNHNHDALGRFCSGSGGSGSGSGGAISSYINSLEPAVEYPERVEHWKKKIQSGTERAILVSDKDLNRVIDGNHALQAYKELGKEPKIYATNRINFLNGAAEKGELEWTREAIANGEAKLVTAEMLGAKKSANLGKTVAKTFSEIIEKFNPWHDARGRFCSGNSGSATFMTVQTKDPKKQHMADMAIARLKQQQQSQPQQPQAAPPPPPKPQKNYDRLGYADQDDADYHQLYNGRQYYQQQQLTATQQQTANNYLESYPEPGSLYSHSQNMNWQMVQGQKLTGKYKQTHDGLMKSMHNLGYNLELTRYDHADFINGMLKATGAGNNYEHMSASAIKKALVGKTINENKFLSTSYNDFSKAPQSSKNVFDTRAVKITYKAKADVQGMMPGIGSGGDLGEIILAPTNGSSNRGGKIVDAKLTGQMVRRKGTQMYNQPRIELVIEI